MQYFRKLLVWEKSHAVALSLYVATRGFPREEMFGLTSQIRRAASSIPANIAEGCGRARNNELRQFLFISLGSASELQYHLLLARDLHFLPEKQFAALESRVTELKRMLYGLIEKIKRAGDRGSN